jgi:hypothetical protein
MNKNFLAYQKLELSNIRKFKPGEYIVVVGGKLFRKGKNLSKILDQAKKKYPSETPLIAKVPQKAVFIFFYD